MSRWALAVTGCVAVGLLAAQEKVESRPDGWRNAEDSKSSPESKAVPYTVEKGTRVPLALLNSVSTKNSAEGDRVYLETLFPVLVNGRIVIPPGSYVAGTVTQVKRPGRVKGRGELYVRFDSLTLPNGASRDFRARIGGVDGLSGQQLDRSEGKVRSEGNKAGDARTIGEAAAAGASVGIIAGAATGNYGMGAGIGSAAGAAAGMIGVLLSRGPDAVLAKGSTIEMVLDRPVSFDSGELNFAGYQPPPPPSQATVPASSTNRGIVPRPPLPF